MVIAGVHGHPVQPRIEPIRTTQLVEGEVQSRKHFLPNVFHVFGPSDETRDGPQDPLPICLNDLVESTIVTTPSPLDEFELNQHGHRPQGSAQA
jgi:hypothetical protein